jgi:uncharacterized protein YukE
VKGEITVNPNELTAIEAAIQIKIEKTVGTADRLVKEVKRLQAFMRGEGPATNLDEIAFLQRQKELIELAERGEEVISLRAKLTEQEVLIKDFLSELLNSHEFGPITTKMHEWIKTFSQAVER